MHSQLQLKMLSYGSCTRINFHCIMKPSCARLEFDLHSIVHMCKKIATTRRYTVNCMKGYVNQVKDQAASSELSTTTCTQQQESN